ncbi:MAG: 4a-hydroxytetrahydrobiopterin dehydratase [Fimbriimonadaceae bacterium]|nr:4a-hydroxytetrahydrobiopterin dehydratase [Fimbriimonadaceae bacterium]
MGSVYQARSLGLGQKEYGGVMTLNYIKLDEGQIAKALEAVDGWAIVGQKLSKTFSFSTYKDGVVFASAVAYLSDKLNHHPDLYVGYAKVTVSVDTHDVGGLSPYDFELARRIDSL